MKKHAIWQNHKVVGYIDLTDEQADQLNGIHGIGAYFGHDEETRKDMPQELPEGRELLLYGDILFDIETEEYEGFRRIRVIRLNGVLYMHHSFNGELIEYMELQDLKGIGGDKDDTV